MCTTRQLRNQGSKHYQQQGGRGGERGRWRGGYLNGLRVSHAATDTPRAGGGGGGRREGMTMILQPRCG